eukprot:maker-scaffold2577_size14323-snap-gene-0.3 protein:Tk08570 transcript:maker-scaffold2577_size14323-snap-gene-0.3-mRNA-1 annotation:"---NA---"
MVHCLSGLIAPYRGNPINEERGGQRGIQGLAKRGIGQAPEHLGIVNSQSDMHGFVLFLVLTTSLGVIGNELFQSMVKKNVPISKWTVVKTLKARTLMNCIAKCIATNGCPADNINAGIQFIPVTESTPGLCHLGIHTLPNQEPIDPNEEIITIYTRQPKVRYCCDRLHAQVWGEELNFTKQLDTLVTGHNYWNGDNGRYSIGKCFLESPWFVSDNVNSQRALATGAVIDGGNPGIGQQVHNVDVFHPPGASDCPCHII